ncbi:MAG: hypothetical protein ACR2OE_09520, partial [Thermomicrobiales bacterium]
DYTIDFAHLNRGMNVMFVRSMIVSLLFLLAMPGALLASPATPSSSPTATPQPAFVKQCDEYRAFFDQRQAVIEKTMGPDYPPIRRGVRIEEMANGEARTAADRIHQYLTLVTATPVPAIAADYEHERNKLLEYLASAYRAVADDDMVTLNDAGNKGITAQQRFQNETRALTDKCGDLPAAATFN